MNRDNVKLVYLSIVILMALFTPYSYASDCPWVPLTGMQNNMVVYGDLYVNDQRITDTAYFVGAFGPGGLTDCRAVGTSGMSGTFYYLTLAGNVNGDTMTFKVFDKATGVILDAAEMVTFVSDDTQVTNLHAACALPAAVSLSAPQNNAVMVATNPTLTWVGMEGSYEIEICGNNTCSTVVQSTNGLTNNQWTVTALLQEGTAYWWRVRARNGCGAGSWSSVRKFLTKTSQCILQDIDGDNRLGMAEVIYILQYLSGVR